MKKLSLKFLYSAILPLFLLVLISSGLSSKSYEHVEATPCINKTGITKFDKGKLEYHFGIPFLYLEGTDYEVGLQYGTLLKNELQLMANVEMPLLKRTMIKREQQNAPFYKKPFVKPVANIIFNKKRRQIVKLLPNDIKARIKGMADGSGLSEKFFEEVFVMADYIAGCFSFIFNEDNRIIHARNFDSGKELLGENPVVVTYNITGKQKYVQLGNPSLIWSYSAVNESGISFSEESNNNPRIFEKKKRNALIEGEKVLWHAKNMKAVDSILNEFKSPNDFILNYGSAHENKAAIYDMIGGEIRAKTDVSQYMCGTGGVRSDSIAKTFETIYSARYHNISREEKFNELQNHNDTINPIDKAITIISNTDFYNYSEKLEVYYESINNYQTTQSVVFDAKNNTVYFSYHPYFAAWGDWYKYNYKTNEVSLYKEQDERLEKPSTKSFVELCKLKNYKSWSNKKSTKNYINQLETQEVNHLFAIKDLAWYYSTKKINNLKANTYSEKLINNYPTLVYGYYYLGKSYYNQKKYDQAINILLKALKIDQNPDYYKMKIYKLLALNYSATENHEEKRKYANDALRIHTNYWQPKSVKEEIEQLTNLSK